MNIEMVKKNIKMRMKWRKVIASSWYLSASQNLHLN